MAQESYPEIIQDSGLGREKHPGLRLRRSGKWGVQIYHPIEGKAIWLGTYDSIEEAKNVYHKKKLEMALLHGLDKHKTPICVRGSQTCCKSYKGVRQRRSGRWSAEIRIPFKRKSVYLGTFNTPEEAADANAKKRREFDDTMTALGKKRKCKGGAGENSDSTKPNKNAPLVSSQDSQGSHTKNVVDANCAKGSQTCCVSYKGVRQRRSGRWSAEIKHPFNRRKSVYLGTFNNPGEAADAYAKKRCEFDDAFAERRREFDDALMVLGKKQQRKGQAAENSNSTVTAVSSQDSQENNCTEHAEDEFGVGVAVINSYGQLIGEYSRIDDDLWLTGL